MDLAVASQASNSISILPGNGDGTFGGPVPYSTGGDPSSFPASILALDLNGDGLPDLAIANQGYVTFPGSSISSIAQLQRRLPPAFRYQAALPLVPDYLAYNDLNNDGYADLVAVSSNASAMIVLFGNGDGTLQPPAAYATGNSAGSLAIQALVDGTSLIMVPDQVTGHLWLHTISAGGDIGAAPFVNVGGMPVGIAVGDLNGDGQPDAVVSGGSSDVTVVLGQANQPGTPVGYSLAPSPPMPQAVAIGDMNNDGKPDVVTASLGQPGSPGVLSVLLGHGDGTLNKPVNVQVSQNARSVALADFNRDGNLDAVVAAYGSTFGVPDPGGLLVLIGNGDGNVSDATEIIRKLASGGGGGGGFQR